MNRSLVVFIGLLFALVSVANVNAAPDDDPIQRAALMALYNSTDGPNWNNNDGWGSQTFYCTWYGVECNEASDVIYLLLGYNDLTGTIPPEISGLTKLRSLFLDWNSLYGEIPPELGMLSDLAILSAYINRLSGPIPPELGNLTRLRHLILDINDLEGQIPPSLGNLGNLKELTIRSNDLSGLIPTELGNLDNLLELDLADNSLSGPIPPELGNLDNLLVLNLGTNNLSGQIPPGLGNLTNLGRLHLDGNNFIDPIPHELSNLANLYYLTLDDNICWETPAAAEWASNLLGYAGPTWACGPDDPVQRNALLALYNSTDGPNWSYTIRWGSAASYCRWFGVDCSAVRNVIELNLRRNNLSGNIPPEIGDLIFLRRLSMYENNLTGPIPPHLGNLSQLYSLHLLDNDLSAPIPASLTQMVELDVLTLEENPKLTCWESFAALIWAQGLLYYRGPEEVCGIEITDSYLPYIYSPN